MDLISLFAQVVSIFSLYLRYSFLIFLSFLAVSCAEGEKDQTQELEKAHVVLHTDLGPIYVKLYDQTPRHKANFLSLAERGFFDSLSFNRIIYEFIIQSGDPRFKNGAIDASKKPGPGYTLAGEFSENLVHTRGKIGAAREPDEKNPERRSAGSQFYIVTGKPVKASVLDTMETVGTGFRKGNFYTSYMQAKKSNEFDGDFSAYLEKANFKPFSYTIKQKQTYMKEGGAPHLDFTYTVFGEVIQGMDIATEISKIPTTSSQVPKDTIRILSAEILTR